MSATEWEQSKENAAPLRRGRKVETLAPKAFGISNRDKTERVIDKFERLVRPSEDPDVTEMENDPLEHWLSYIKFYQESFPSDTHEQFLLMERCTRALIKMRQYANDDRFIGVCAKYADKTKEPMIVFKYLHQEKIGTESALLWIAWAFVAERNNDFQFAEQIFKKGISKNAQPLQLLKTRHRQFERRMSRNWMNSSQQSDQIDDEDDDTERRSVLGGTSRPRRGTSMMRQTERTRTFGVRQNRRSTRQTSNANSNTSTTNDFSVFEDEETGYDGYNLDQSHGTGRVIETHAERKKENTMEAERWNERGGLRRGQEAHQRSHSKGPPPAFAVFVDEECVAQHEAEEVTNQAEADHHRRCRDDRTFRERDDEGMGEKLAKDPLRYLRDRTQLESDTAVDSKQKSELAKKPAASVPKSKSGRKQKKGTGFDLRLLRNNQGDEQSFEEARANAKCFFLLPSSENFNLLHTVVSDDQSSQMDLDESSDGMSIGEFPEGLATNTSNPHNSVDARNDSIVSKKSVFGASSFDGSLNRTAISTASSTVDEIGAVGVPTRKEEETINTKFAMRELSMMFSSPAVGADDMVRKTERAILNKSTSANDSYDHVMNIMDHQQMNNSIFNIEEDENNENDGERNYEGRGSSSPGFHEMALKEIEGAQDAANSLSCRAQQRRGIPGELSQENPLSRNEVELHSDAGFQIFEEDRVNENQAIASTKAKSMFAIFQDEDDNTRTKPPAAKASFGIFEDEVETKEPKPPASKSTFTIFDDEAESSTSRLSKEKSSFAIFQDEQDSTAVQSFSRESRNGRSSKAPGFSIFDEEKRISSANDVKQSPQSSHTASDNGETATLSLFEGAIGMLAGNDDSNCSGRSEPSVNEDRKRQSSGDTASISLFNEAFAEFGIETSEKGLSQEKPPSASSKKHKFDIFVDESTRDAKRACRSRFQQKRRDPIDIDADRQNASVDYLKVHEHESQEALQHLQRSSVVPRSNVSLTDLLSSAGDSFDLPHLLVPKLLLRKSVIPSKAKLCIGGKYSGRICNELGRGTYGVVVLMKKHKTEEVMAVKSQTPTSCLALEYQNLRRLEERVSSKQGCHPFPKPLSFISLADGGILTMTAGSKSGLNLVDMVNIYRVKLGETVPELLALHYTSRMLKHIETMHRHGRILHCDVKPDNFVLCKLDCPDNAYRQIEYSDLFLVDFGRSVDLDLYSNQFRDARNAMFRGNASCPEARCIAMRNGMPWSYDIDTFGILSSAHILLFGNHMELRQSRDSRWHIQHRFRRYWNKDLWSEIFNSLMYPDEETGFALESRVRNLRSLYEKINDCIKGDEAKITALLKRQAALLPKRRDQMG
ncbi:unnamed protein product [Cylindrotheca closterium]|uniref:Non-specific serine/threonine protein kinase n=1 Tax=Cylindrotheca closterium TaxID=2856 RepID=A0AAD2GAR0_9STRA|nr:unnamed protein product [Cylindrotheca closterium]